MHVEDPPRALTLDGEGRFVHEGVVVTHPRLVALLHRSIARRDDGGYVVTTGRDALPLDVVDTPFFVRTLEREGDVVSLVLSDDTREPIVPSTRLVVDDDGRIRARVKGDRAWAKLLRPAHAAVLDGLIDDVDARDSDETVCAPLGGPRVGLKRARRDEDWRA